MTRRHSRGSRAPRTKPTWQYHWGTHPFCGLCGEWVHPREASVDHVIPRSKGGPDSLENTILAHCSCNEMKGDRWPDEDLLVRLMVRNGWGPVTPLGHLVSDFAFEVGIDPTGLPVYEKTGIQARYA